MFVHAPKLLCGVVGVTHRRLFRNAQDTPQLLRRLAFHRPAQARLIAIDANQKVVPLRHVHSECNEPVARCRC